MSRHEYGPSCPLAFSDPMRWHVWIETTMPHYSERRFSCDSCTAVATEARAKIGGVS